MERVTYQFPATDDEATLEGKFEAVVEVVCNDPNRSDVLPGANVREATVAYAEGERQRIEPVVLAIVRNADGTFWDIAERAIIPQG